MIPSAMVIQGATYALVQTHYRELLFTLLEACLDLQVSAYSSGGVISICQVRRSVRRGHLVQLFSRSDRVSH